MRSNSLLFCVLRCYIISIVDTDLIYSKIPLPALSIEIPKGTKRWIYGSLFFNFLFFFRIFCSWDFSTHNLLCFQEFILIPFICFESLLLISAGKWKICLDLRLGRFVSSFWCVSVSCSLFFWKMLKNFKFKKITATKICNGKN